MSAFSYNLIKRSKAGDRIEIDSNPDQFTRNTVLLTKDDYERVKAEACKLGWENSESNRGRNSRRQPASR